MKPPPPLLGLGLFLVFFFVVVLNSGITQSAIVRNNAIRPNAILRVSFNKTAKENITMELLEEAIDDYIDLSNAFYSPAINDSIRQKRTLGVFRALANKTRRGVATLRNLFSGLRGSSSSSSSESGTTGRGGFRMFFSNLLQRILVFLTNVGDRITSLFRRPESAEGGNPPGGFFARIRTAASGIFSRLTGGGASGSGGGGFLSGIFRPAATTEKYVIDYSDANDESSVSDSADDSGSKGNDLDLDLTDDSASSGSSTSTTEVYEKPFEKEVAYLTGKEEGGYDTVKHTGPIETSIFPVLDNIATGSFGVNTFIPFPQDSDPNFHLNGALSSLSGPTQLNPWASAILPSSAIRRSYPTYYTRK